MTAIEASRAMTASSLNRDGTYFWALPVVCIGIAAAIAASDLNIPLFLWIQRATAGESLRLWQSITLFGNGLVAAALCAAWLRSRPEAVWAALLGALPAAIIVRLFKSMMDVPRPLAILSEQVHILGPAYRHGSFPSGDAVTAFLLAGVAWAVYRTARVRVLILLAAALVGFSRIVIGVHWPIDVLCGAAAGWVCAHVGMAGAARWGLGLSQRSRIAPAQLLLLASIALFFVKPDLPLSNLLRWSLAAAGCVMSAAALSDALGFSAIVSKRLRSSVAGAPLGIRSGTLAAESERLRRSILMATGPRPAAIGVAASALEPPSAHGVKQASLRRRLVGVARQRECGAPAFIVGASVFNVVLFSEPLFRFALSTFTAMDLHAVLALVTVLVLQLVISVALLGAAALLSSRLVKPLCILFALGNAVALYFITHYGVIVDATTSGNVLKTSFAEAAELAHPKLLLYLGVFGALPAVAIARMRLIASSRARLFAVVLVSLAIGATWLYANARTWLWIDKNAKQLGGLVLPWSYVVNPIRYYKQENARHVAPELLPPLTSTDPRRVVFVLIIGESARAQNFSLYGYGRDTNPLLARSGAIALRGARSCATYTTAALRCMLSHRGNAAGSANDEPLPSYLHRYGVEVLWRTNNFGEPPMDVSSFEHAAQIRSKCTRACERADFDEVLLEGLTDRLRDAPDGTKTLVVLHQAGSHGPQYFRKYPPEFERFKPTCRTVDLQQCSREELINAYDNTIAYTDSLLDRVITQLKSLKGTASVMLYMSDHGESLGEHGLYLHGIPMSIAPDVQTSVPLVVWMSDEFMRRAGATPRCLRDAKDLSDDAVFHSVLGALALTSKVYVPEHDLFRCGAK